MESKDLRILVAASNKEIYTFLQCALQGRNHQFSYFGDGQAVVEAVASQNFDLAMLDTDLNCENSVAVAKHIKALTEQKHQWLPIFLICTTHSEELVVQGVTAGVDQFLYKPLQAEVVLAKVDAFARSITVYHKLLEDKARNQVIADGILDAVISIDKNGIILTVNKAVESMFGYLSPELIGRKVNILMPEPHRSQHDTYIENFLQTGIKKIIGTPGREVQGLRKNGELFDLRIGVSEITVDDEPVFISILSDITNIKKAEDELRKNSREMSLLHDAIQYDLDMANVVMEQLVDKSALDDPQLSYYIQPAVKFSGDLVLCKRGPCGKLYVMVADATGHGLSAAISVLPALWVFYGMVKKSATVPEIAAELNFRLKQSIPVGRFVAAHIASINNPAQTVRLWSGGMPAAWIVDDDGAPAIELPSMHPALGILDNELFNPGCHIFEWRGTERLLFLSDGVSEARCEEGDGLGDGKVLEIIHDNPGEALLTRLVTLLQEHLSGNSAMDDISIACVHLRR